MQIQVQCGQHRGFQPGIHNDTISKGEKGKINQPTNKYQSRSSLKLKCTYCVIREIATVQYLPSLCMALGQMLSTARNQETNKYGDGRGGGEQEREIVVEIVSEGS